MFGIGSRTFYAICDDLIFNFEYKRDRDYFVAHMKDAKILSAHDYYKIEGFSFRTIRVEASCKVGADKYRKKQVEDWYHADK